jgi:nucleoside-diphosphate-sugar epimerase
MKIVVTGAAGYIGSVLCDMLTANHNNNVVGIDNCFNPEIRLGHLVCRHNFSFCHEDVIHIADNEHFHSCDVLVHLAGIVGLKACNDRPDAAWMVNHVATANIASKLPASTQLISVCTNSGYGNTESGICNEDTPIAPLSIYGRSKLSGELAVLSRLNSTSLRFSTVFGMSTAAATRWELLVNDFTKKAFETGEISLFEPNHRRNFLYIKDAARAIIHCIGHRRIDGLFNVGLSDGANLTKLELGNLIAKVVGDVKVTSMKGRDEDQRSYYIDNSKFKATGFEFGYPLESGIKELVRYLSDYSMWTTT